MGTYSADRQPALERLLLEPARRVAGAALRRRRAACTPTTSPGPTTSSASSTCRPREHRALLLRAQRFTLNVTRADMIARRPLAERAPVRGRGLRRADHHRRLARPGRLFRPGHEILSPARRGRVHYLRPCDADRAPPRSAAAPGAASWPSTPPTHRAARAGGLRRGAAPRGPRQLRAKVDRDGPAPLPQSSRSAGRGSDPHPPSLRLVGLSHLRRARRRSVICTSPAKAGGGRRRRCRERVRTLYA